jgi:hypothetical protein
MWPRLLFADCWVPLLAVTSHFFVLGTRINEILDVSTSKLPSTTVCCHDQPGAEWRHDKPVIVGATAYLIFWEYPAYPPAPWSTTTKGSDDTVLALTLRFVRYFTNHGPWFDVWLRWNCLFYSWHAACWEAETQHFPDHAPIRIRHP